MGLQAGYDLEDACNAVSMGTPSRLRHHLLDQILADNKNPSTGTKGVCFTFSGSVLYN